MCGGEASDGAGVAGAIEAGEEEEDDDDEGAGVFCVCCCQLVQCPSVQSAVVGGERLPVLWRFVSEEGRALCLWMRGSLLRSNL